MFLVHNRPISRPVDDSVVQFIKGQMGVVRRARGFAPLPVAVVEPGPTILGLGGHLKNSIAIKVKENIFLSQHIGDLETPLARQAFQQTFHDLQKLYPSESVSCAGDLHPDYFSTQFMLKNSKNIFSIQHHHAHIVSCMAEHQIRQEVLGLAWDGTGLGEDKQIWGGEFLICTTSQFKRLGHLRPFRIPGGDQAIKEPARTALGLLYEQSGGQWEKFSDLDPFKHIPGFEAKIIKQMIQNGINSPWTTSMGRLFDAVASLLEK